MMMLEKGIKEYIWIPFLLFLIENLMVSVFALEQSYCCVKVAACKTLLAILLAFLKYRPHFSSLYTV
jgi:hypothetical protein